MALSSYARVALAVAAVVGLGAPALAGPLTTSFTVTGAVAEPATFDAAALGALPQSSALVGSDTYAGTTMWKLLNTVGMTGSGKNPTLRSVVLVTGSDGYATAFSGGELNPMFGGSINPALVATTINGEPLTTNGFARTVVPGDSRRGRFVSNMANVAVSQVAAAAGTGGVSSQFSVTGLVKDQMTVDLAKLQSLPAVTKTVSFVTGTGPVTTRYTGVSLWDLLSLAVVVTDPAVKNDILRDYVVATGSDGYRAVFSMGELDPDFGNGGEFIAYEGNGSTLGSDGFARIVVPGDVHGGRYVSNLISLEIMSAVPEPTTVLLLLPALGSVLLLRLRPASSGPARA